ncbi:hypothetical protein AMECASPLE_019099 [Ameca splendens]|uniref:Uncharacterized protein n=1 Tax=Ameca splendens TaxID=208324 RepID=A0ABV0ZBP6_9TELE
MRGPALFRRGRLAAATIRLERLKEGLHLGQLHRKSRGPTRLAILPDAKGTSSADRFVEAAPCPSGNGSCWRETAQSTGCSSEDSRANRTAWGRTLQLEQA